MTRPERRDADTRIGAGAVRDDAHGRPPDPASVGHAAADYARRGYGVFPTHAPSNRPRFRKGTHPRWAPDPDGPAGLTLASWDPADVERWWPMARGTGVGIVPPEGVAILDLDEKHVAGIVDTVLERWPQLRDGGLHRSRSNGGHVPGRVPTGYRLPQSVDRDRGVDVRAGLKGYVVAPPTPGYTVVAPFVAATELPAFPLDLLGELLPTEAPAHSKGPPIAPQLTSRNRLRRYVWAAIKGEYEAIQACREGSRNDTLHASAVKLGTLVGAGVLSEADARDALLAAVTDSPDPLPRWEADRTITSGLQWGAKHPRQIEVGTV